MRGGKILTSYPADPPKKVFITGPDSVRVGDVAEYGCVVEGGLTSIRTLYRVSQYPTPVSLWWLPRITSLSTPPALLVMRLASCRLPRR